MKNGRINLRRLEAPHGAESVENILVIWTATHPEGGSYIVGWYNGATVYAQHRERPATRETKTVVRQLFFSAKAPAARCRILPLDERVFRVPTHLKGYPGQSPSFFPTYTTDRQWLGRVRKYVDTGNLPTPPVRNDDKGRPVDPEFRSKVEKSAIKVIQNHYEKLGFNVISREPDKIGWDLEARRGDLVLRLEVKGLSGSAPNAELTPNEYKTMRSHRYRSSYRICIVTNAHLARSATKYIFGYDAQLSDWVSEELHILAIKERIAASIGMA